MTDLFTPSGGKPVLRPLREYRPKERAEFDLPPVHSKALQSLQTLAEAFEWRWSLTVRGKDITTPEGCDKTQKDLVEMLKYAKDKWGLRFVLKREFDLDPPHAPHWHIYSPDELDPDTKKQVETRLRDSSLRIAGQPDNNRHTVWFESVKDQDRCRGYICKADKWRKSKRPLNTFYPPKGWASRLHCRPYALIGLPTAGACPRVATCNNPPPEATSAGPGADPVGGSETATAVASPPAQKNGETSQPPEASPSKSNILGQELMTLTRVPERRPKKLPPEATDEQSPRSPATPSNAAPCRHPAQGRNEGKPGRSQKRVFPRFVEVFPSFRNPVPSGGFPRFVSKARRIIELAKGCSGPNIRWFKGLWNPANGTEIARGHPDTVAILKTHNAVYCAIRLEGGAPLPPAFVPTFAIPLDSEIVMAPPRKVTTTGGALLSNTL